MIRSASIRQSAKGEVCTINGPTCAGGTATTVFCHLNESFAGKGMGLKADDIGFYGCHMCHMLYDTGQLPDPYFYVLRGVVRTLRRLIEKGIVTIK